MLVFFSLEGNYEREKGERNHSIMVSLPRHYRVDASGTGLETNWNNKSLRALTEHLFPPPQCSFPSWWQCISTAHCCGYGGRKSIHRTGTLFQEQEIFLSSLDSTLSFLLHQPRLPSCLSVPPEHQTFTVIPSLTHAILISQHGNYCCSIQPS